MARRYAPVGTQWQPLRTGGIGRRFRGGTTTNTRVDRGARTRPRSGVVHGVGGFRGATRHDPRRPRNVTRRSCCGDRRTQRHRRDAWWGLGRRLLGQRFGLQSPDALLERHALAARSKPEPSRRRAPRCGRRVSHQCLGRRLQRYLSGPLQDLDPALERKEVAADAEHRRLALRGGGDVAHQCLGRRFDEQQ